MVYGVVYQLVKIDRLNPAIKGSMGAARTDLETVPLDVTTSIEPKPTPSWVPTPAVGPNMVVICSEGGSKSDEELGEAVEESVWGLRGL